MKLYKFFQFSLCAFICPLLAQAQNSGVLNPTSNYDYRVKANGVQWILEVTSTSKYSKDGIPLSLSSLVKIEKKGEDSSSTSQVSISKYPNEGGMLFIEMDQLKSPLFIILSKGGPLGDHQKSLQLISPLCHRPLAEALAEIEEPEQVQIQVSTRDFVLSFNGPKGPTKKTWTAPADSSKLCSQKWQ